MISNWGIRVLIASVFLTVLAVPAFADDIGHGAPDSTPSDPVDTEQTVWEELLEWFETDTDQ